MLGESHGGPSSAVQPALAATVGRCRQSSAAGNHLAAAAHPCYLGPPHSYPGPKSGMPATHQAATPGSEDTLRREGVAPVAPSAQEPRAIPDGDSGPLPSGPSSAVRSAVAATVGCSAGIRLWEDIAWATGPSGADSRLILSKCILFSRRLPVVALIESFVGLPCRSRGGTPFPSLGRAASGRLCCRRGRDDTAHGRRCIVHSLVAAMNCVAC